MNEKVNRIKHIMIETVHRCLRCNKVAYEIVDGVFKCSDNNCAFEWEIINCGE